MNPDERCTHPHWCPPRSFHYRLLLLLAPYADQTSAVKNDGIYTCHQSSVLPVQAHRQRYLSTYGLSGHEKEKRHYFLITKPDPRLHCDTMNLRSSIHFHGFPPTFRLDYLLLSHKYWNGNTDWTFWNEASSQTYIIRLYVFRPKYPHPAF